LLQGYQAKQTYEYNAAVARQEAKYAKQRSAIEQEQYRRQLAQRVSYQRAVQGKSGTTGGTNINALERTIREGEYDAELIRYGGDVDAWRAGAAANLYKDSGSKMMGAGAIGAGSTLLTGASRWDWKKFGTTKKFGDLFK
jgi:hypothetical protein